MNQVIVFSLLPECEVCGKRMDKQFLKPWNGKEVCSPCIDLLEAEYDQLYSNDLLQR